MRKLFFPAALATVLLATGCGDLVSLHPLFTARDTVTDDGLIGRWENKTLVVEVEKAGGGYRVTMHAKETPDDQQNYELRLGDLAGERLGDLVSDQLGHYIVRVKHTASELRFAFLDSKWLLDQIPHDNAEIMGGVTQAVLTVPTAEVRKLVTQYASDARAYDEDIILHRP